MPIVDMSVEELHQYQGINPKPKDFDQFWEKSLNEMKAVDAEISITPADFQSPAADCFDLYFTGVHGARVYAKLVKPKKINGKCPAVVMFHGYTGNCGDWQSKIGYAASGFVVAALDCRGQGGKSEDVGGTLGNTQRGHIIRGLDGPPDKLLYRDIFLDTAQLAGIVMDMEEVDQNRVGALGGSQGGGLTLACAALEPRIQRAAPVYPFLVDYKRVWEMDLANPGGAYSELIEYFRHFDPRHEREEEIFTKLGYIDIQHLAPRIRAEVQMATGLMDMTCPPSTQFAAYNKITSRKRVMIYPDFGHEGLPGADDSTYQFMMGL